MNRRDFVVSSMAAAASAALPAQAPAPRFAHRQAQMPLAPGQNVFQLAEKIPGLSGVQLQVIWKGEDISEGTRAAELRQQARDSGILTPSIAGIWKPKENIFQPEIAERAIANSIRAAQALESHVILIAMFKENCPDMSDAASYGPAVALLKKMAPRAQDAGVTLGLETSLAPSDDHKLIDLIGSPHVRVYYDATNTESYHPGTAIDGIRELHSIIAEAHLKNETRLLDQQPSKVNWKEAIRTYAAVGYRGWFCFETEHATPERCIADTIHNMAFVREQLAARS